MEDNRWTKETLEASAAGFMAQGLAPIMGALWDDLTFADVAKGIAKQVAVALYGISQNYKYSVVCTFGKKNQAAPKVESVCMWDPDNDVHVSICQDTYYLYCILNVSAICLDK
jgi:hypothetical protein